MNCTTSDPSINFHSLIEFCREFASKHPPSSIMVSVRCNRAFIDNFMELAKDKATVVGANATANPELILFGVKIIEDESVPDCVYYVKYADGHEEMVTPFGTFSRDAESINRSRAPTN